MKIIQKYQCGICHEVYDFVYHAQQCEEQGVATPQYKVGDVVAIQIRYPDDPCKPFAKRTITNVVTEGWHYPEYELNDTVQVGKVYWIGSEAVYRDDGGLATERYFKRFGEPISADFQVPMSIVGQILTDAFCDLDY